MVIKRLWFHLDAVTRIERRHVTTILHHYWKDEVFVQMIDILYDSVLKGSADRDVIEERKMLNIFAKPDSAGMWTNRHAELCRHQQHGQHLIHSAETTAIDLTETDRVGLHQLFEDHPVLTMFAGRHANGLDRTRNLRMAQHVIGRGRLLYPIRVEGGQLFHPINRLIHIPNLIGIHHQLSVRTDLLANQARSSHIIVEISPDFHFEMRPSLR